MTTLKVPEQKVILCGEYGVGKSSLFRRFTSNTYTTSTDRQSTLGLDHYSKRYHVAGKDIKLQLWDTGGMERVASITSSYYKFADAAILVFSLDSPESFNMVSQHLLDIVSYAENAKIYLCGNKSDLKSLIQITDSDMEAFCEQCHTLVAGTFKLSCKTGEGVDEMFSSIALQLAESNRSKFELEKLTENNGLQLTDLEDNENLNKCSC
ncbi:ras-like GTP-binding protein YPT1 [Daphnia magna]|uniref:RabX6 n=1 Tax=Daphnia magna TaxID=35525 RepID=A0A164PXF9_9CRUS|nr:ras-like GTP-binding protein YPT1 [Daphnia magna]XP_045029208.1 ras-like GTP-binding protein YPT1 [Daphnia magna]KZS07237.1 RabX6 [Daphnia magna]